MAARVKEAAGPPAVKGERVKAVIGFLAFFLGISLVFGSLGTAAGRLIARRDADLNWSGGWQRTQAFRDQVSGYLLAFLNLGAGEDINWYDGDGLLVLGGDYGRPTRYVTEVVVSDVPYEDVGRPQTEADSERDAAADAAYRDDKNVLYCIKKNGEVLYQNGASRGNVVQRGLEKDGYNFYLAFENGKASIVLDGQPLDVYGDGIYDGDSLWFLPGYDNFLTGEALEGVSVYMAVRREPVRYYGQNGSDARWGGSPMYYVVQRMEAARTFYLRQAALLGVGLACLCVFFALRREKRLADRRIAAWTGRVWTEVWLLPAAAVLAWLLVSRSWEELYWMCQDLWWGYDYGVGRQLLYGAASFALSVIPAVLALGWNGWLLFNHCRYNSREGRKSLIRSILRGVRALSRSLRVRDLKRPVERRITRTILAGTAALALVLAVLAAFLLDVLPHFRYYSARWQLISMLAAVMALAVLVLLVSAFRSRRLGRDLGRLNDQVEAIRAGNLAAPLDLPEDADLHRTAEALNDIQAGMRAALAEQTRSERMKVELISNVSHDLKTPLTSILSYAELLRQEELPPAAADYARIIDEKARRLKSMVQDVFEVSKAAADQLPVHLERLDLGKLLRQTLADLDGPIRESPLTFKIDLPAEPVMITADGKRLYRVFQNLIDNALGYALEGSRVYLTLKTAAGQAEASVRNTSRSELPEGVDFTARFVRGDESRTDGGSGLGLSIASSFTEACGGTFRVETVADLFTAVVTFPLAAETEARL